MAGRKQQTRPDQPTGSLVEIPVVSRNALQEADGAKRELLDIGDRLAIVAANDGFGSQAVGASSVAHRA